MGATQPKQESAGTIAIALRFARTPPISEAMTTELDRVGACVEEAFARFGASLLWNIRRPDARPGRNPPDPTRLARKLAREGGADAVDLAGRMLAAVAESHARSIPAADPSAHRC